MKGSVKQYNNQVYIYNSAIVHFFPETKQIDNYKICM